MAQILLGYKSDAVFLDIVFVIKRSKVFVFFKIIVIGLIGFFNFCNPFSSSAETKDKNQKEDKHSDQAQYNKQDVCQVFYSFALNIYYFLVPVL